MPHPQSEKPSSERSSVRSTLFLRPSATAEELWDGPRTGLVRAPSMFAFDEARDISSLGSHLSRLLPKYDHVFVDAVKRSPKKKSLFNFSTTPSSNLTSLDDALGHVNWSSVRPLAPEIHQMRKFKSESEVAIMRKAASVSATAHHKVQCSFTELCRYLITYAV